MYVPLAELPHQQDTYCMKGIGIGLDLKGSSYTSAEDRKENRAEKEIKHSQRKDKCAAIQKAV